MSPEWILESLRGALEQWASYPEPERRFISAIGIEVHWVILQYVMGLPLISLVAQLLYLKTRDRFWEDLAWKMVKGFVIVFAVGAATGTAAEFGLILLWPNFTEAGGKWIYFPFYAEIYAFIIEVIFVYFLYYGWRRLGPIPRIVLTSLVILGAWYSAAMILAVNSFMVAPTGLQPAYTPGTGPLYGEGYPKITLYIPPEVAGAIDPERAKALGIVVRESEGLVEASLPVKITYRLFWEASKGFTVSQSVLAEVLKPNALEELGEASVAKVLDSILYYTLEVHDPLLYPLKSPVWLPSVGHAIGSGVVISAYTVAGAYALRLLRGSGDAKRSLRALRFSLALAVASLAIQGAVLGHEQALAIAKYAPEVLAAMEGVTDEYFSISRHLLLGIPERLVAFLAYGSFSAPLPSYDQIPVDYCSFPDSPIVDCRPPILVHYLYYTKVGMALALGVATLALLVKLYRWGSLGRRDLVVVAASPLVAQTVSFLGWAVREVGRKPFTVYGLFTPAEAANPVGPDTASLALVGVYLLAILAVLGWAVYRFLWR
ncbi:MAG: cytochrome ubiquinol oxidase subunit I [Desulfurococcales archaeon]|nr:cytochrome ubiquinol oxidase subunit I [Desulfurococcales archaeon]